jgi:hypothetical protein
MTLRVRPEEPGVDPEAEVEPAVGPNEDNGVYCAWPDARHRWLSSQLPKSDQRPVRKFQVTLNLEVSADGPGCATVETAYTVHVKELCYPGGRWDIADADDKWLYAFRSGTLAVEARCTRGDVWEGWTVDGSARRPWRSVRGVRLDPGPRDQRYQYAYLLSPVQLTPEAIRLLERGGDGASPPLGLVVEPCDIFDPTVYLPDPLRWACEANEKYYQPRLRTLEAWTFDEGIVSYAFVAGALKRWIDDGDRVGVQNELQRSPESWLEQREAGRRKARLATDEAAAYLAHCVDSLDYAAVEQSCVARGDETLELAAVALQRATTGLTACEPGRKLIQQLAKNPERLPARMIFQDEGPKLPDQWFERYRFGQKALLALFTEMLPAVIDWRTPKAGHPEVTGVAAIPKGKMSARLQESLALRERAMKYLENLGVKTRLNERQVRILEKLRLGTSIAKGLPKTSEAAKGLREEWHTLLQIEEVRRAAPSQVDAGAQNARDLPKRLAPYVKHAKRLEATAGTAVEVANFVSALLELKKAKEELAQGERSAEEVQKKKWSVAGAVADFIEHGAGMAGEVAEHEGKMIGMLVERQGRVPDVLLREQLAQIARRGTLVEAAKVFGSGFGFVGGAIDMVDFEEQLVEALGEYDYGKAVGRGMQAAGAAGSAAGSMMSLAAMALESGGGVSALGFWGAAVGFTGGALVAGGFLVAKWLSLNANEVFASRCFLGKHWGEVAKDVSWSEDRLPTSDPKLEAKVLVDLLAQFQLSSLSGLGDWHLLIYPGFLEDDWAFELEIERHALNCPSTHYSVRVDFKEGRIAQTAGLPLKLGEMDRDRWSHGEPIDINLEEVNSRETGLGWQFPTVTVLVWLVSPGKGRDMVQRVPKSELRAVRTVLPSSNRISSLDATVQVSLKELRKGP